MHWKWKVSFLLIGARISGFSEVSPLGPVSLHEIEFLEMHGKMGSKKGLLKRLG